ncbi:MAG: hypothetical protein JNL38_14835 [Myxococcales bacterium]|nr:hypothetical protein [Myxococcales bacterium]
MRLGVATSLVLAFAASLGAEGPGPAPDEGPRTWLWAWERPEDLRFLGDRRDVGVAILTRTVTVGDAGVEVRRRAHPAHVPPGVPLAAVVRVQLRRGSTAFAAHGPALARAVVDAAGDAPARTLQIDFDAPPPAWGFYRELIERVTAALPPSTSLAVTAVASWCTGAGPLPEVLAAGRPAPRVVPMLFAMGPDAARVRFALAARGDFPEPACRGAIGVAVDEPAPHLYGARPVWAFSRHPWTAADLAALDAR